MPIFEYRPLDEDGKAISQEKAAERLCCFFEFLSLQKEQPFDKCPNCGRPVGRAPSGFAMRFEAGLGANSRPEERGMKRTVAALRSEGLGEFAEAWMQAVDGRGHKESRMPSEKSPSLAQAQGVRELIEGHICSTACKH